MTDHQNDLVELAARRCIDDCLTRDGLDLQLDRLDLTAADWQRNGIEALVTIIGAAAAKVKRGKFRAIVDCEGSTCAVGAFKTRADADLFRLMMFSSDIGFTTDSRTPPGEKMSVRGFQDAFRADFGPRPPEHWGARW